ncbi:unnamed protein product [Protopolystoma xenopodis]|uniref:Ig-like domain-containing protein n=1 Tax=Protopolystoma xenopodis TaxID=117903 RepID=A0A448WVF0_9PLAT|nr:unnamed protein product [Protopolystoma xenopodis]
MLRVVCEAESGIPGPKISWQLNNVSLSQNQGFYTLTESGLFIFNSLKFSSNLLSNAPNSRGYSQTFCNGASLSPADHHCVCREADEGELTCIARNSAGEDRLTFQISVLVPPRVHLPPSNLGYEDKPVTLECTVFGRPEPKVTWEFNGQSIASALGNRAQFVTPAKLTIHSLQVRLRGGRIAIRRKGTDDKS